MGIDLDNTNQVLLKPEFFAINTLEATHESPINDEIILKEVKAALLSDEVTKDYKSLLKSGPREFEKSLQDWNYENRLLLYRGKIYIPHSVEDTLRQQIVQMHHDLPSTRHPGWLSGTCGAGAELPWNGRDLTTKVGEQPWPQLVCCASIDCCACDCVFQED